MSGSFYSLWVNPASRRLVFSMGLPLRVGLALVWLSLTLALVPGFLPGSGVLIEPEGWITAGSLWLVSTLGLGWKDRWVFDAAGRFHRDRGWFLLFYRKTRSLAGFDGWTVETHPVRPLDLAGRRGALEFKTAEGRWRIDTRFKAEWLASHRAALDLWAGWLKEGKTP